MLGTLFLYLPDSVAIDLNIELCILLLGVNFWYTIYVVGCFFSSGVNSKLVSAWILIHYGLLMLYYQ